MSDLESKKSPCRVPFCIRNLTVAVTAVSLAVNASHASADPNPTPPKVTLLTTTDQVEVWYWKNREAISEDATNSIFALLDANIADNAAVFDAQKERVKRAESAAKADVKKAKEKLLDDLKKNQNGVPSPPLFKVRTEREHLDEIRRSIHDTK